MFFHQTLTFRLLPNPAKVGMSVEDCNSEDGFPVDWSARSCSLGIGSQLISRAKEIKCLRGLPTCDGEMECEMTTRWDAGLRMERTVDWSQQMYCSDLNDVKNRLILGADSASQPSKFT